MLLVPRLGIPPMTLRPLRDLHLGRPRRRDRRFLAASAGQFFLGYGELVRLAGLDHEVASAVLPMPLEMEHRK